jgi:hypothetical protein
MQCTVHCIIYFISVGNVLMCVIYQSNFAIFMYVTRIKTINVEFRTFLTQNIVRNEIILYIYI